MAVDIPKQTSESEQGKERSQDQANMQSKTGGQETVSSTEECQRRWIQQQEKHQEQQKRLAQQGAIKDARERRERVQTTQTIPKKKFMDGMGKYLIPSVATGGGIIGMLFGIN